MRVCVISDNHAVCKKFMEIVSRKEFAEYSFDFYCSELNKNWNGENLFEIKTIELKKEEFCFFEKYELFISLHSKQVFPIELVKNYRCINIHPGYNPYNRGWYPQVFSIINKKPVGVTIHEMDEELDHGSIIFQELVEIREEDTSFDVYSKIIEKEIQMLSKYLKRILERDYTAFQMMEEGNLNTKKDFAELCKIDLQKKATYKEVIDVLRATTFQGCRNAYFYNENGEKIFISVRLEKE